MSFVTLTPVTNKKNSGQPQPLDFSFKFDGKDYEIKFIKQRIGTDTANEKEIDLKNLDQAEIDQFKNEAIKVLEAVKDGMPDDWTSMKSSNSFSLKFSQQPSNPGPINSTIGRVFKQYAYKKSPVILETIIHSGTTIQIQKKLQEEPETHEKITAALDPLHEHINRVASRKKRPKTEKPQVQPTPANASSNNNNTTTLGFEEVDPDGEEPLRRGPARPPVMLTSFPQIPD